MTHGDEVSLGFSLRLADTGIQFEKEPEPLVYLRSCRPSALLFWQREAEDEVAAAAAPRAAAGGDRDELLSVHHVHGW